jgi:hypothetical protein
VKFAIAPRWRGLDHVVENLSIRRTAGNIRKSVVLSRAVSQFHGWQCLKTFFFSIFAAASFNSRQSEWDFSPRRSALVSMFNILNAKTRFYFRIAPIGTRDEPVDTVPDSATKIPSAFCGKIESS